MESALGRDPQVALAFGAESTSLTAAGTGDNTEVTGQGIDLSSLAASESIAWMFGVKAALTDTESITLKTVTVQDSADGSSWSDVEVIGTILTYTSSGGGTVRTTAIVKYDRNKLRKHARLKYTPDLSASGTDTAVVQCIAGAFGLRAAA